MNGIKMFITVHFKELIEMVVNYNTAVWPLQLVVYSVGFSAVFFAIKKTSYSSLVVSGVLAFFWIWVGIVFNLMYFSKLFPLAIVFAVLFVIEGIILVITGFFKKNLSFCVKTDLYGIVGGIFILYAMIGYPAIEYILGRGYPQLLSFGLVPCPTTIFTLGMLLWSDKRLPKYVLVIPFLYSLSGVIPIYLGVVEDIGLVTAGLITTVLILYRDRMKE